MADITQVKVGNTTYDIKDSRVDGLVTGVSSVNGQTGNVTISIPTIPTNHVTTDTTQTITANKTHTGVNTFSNGNFSIRANSGNDDSWIQLTNSGNSAYYAFGIRRPYTSYGLQLKYHPDASNPDSSRPGTGTSDIYYDIYHQGNYTKIPAATTSTAGLMSAADKIKADWLDLDTSDGTIFTIGNNSATSAYINLNNNDDSINAIGNEVFIHSTGGMVHLKAADGLYLISDAGVHANGSKVLTEANIDYDPTNKILTIS